MMTNATLKYHFHPGKGWINDPNGLCFYKGKYHIFYQHIPDYEYTGESAFYWGHAVTSDFLRYTELPIAVKPDAPYDFHGAWSGTATEIDGRLYLFYCSIDADITQKVSIAYSDDGVSFTKYEGNPVIRDYPENGGKNFRDPAILVENGVYYLVIASSDEKKGTGNLRLYKSTDIFHWEYAGVLIEYENCSFCECPSFVKHGDGYILSTSVCPKGKKHYFEVMYGSFDGKKFTPQIVSHFQKGPDEYAGQIFDDKRGRSILMSWVPGWDYMPKEKCIGCLSLPLELTVENGEIKAYPVTEVQGLLDENDTLIDSYIEEKFINKGREVYITLLEKPEKK